MIDRTTLGQTWYRIIVLCCALLFGATAAPAATLNVNGFGQLLGAFNVDVGGQFYDVSFVDGTCIALFGGCDEATDFTFQNESDGLTASQALLDQVFIDDGAGNFDTQPSLTVGCVGSGQVNCWAWTPVLPDTLTSVKAAVAANNAVFDTGNNSYTFPINIDLTEHTEHVWAVWSPVPEPGTGLLIAGGLALLSARRRRAAGR